MSSVNVKFEDTAQEGYLGTVHVDGCGTHTLVVMAYVQLSGDEL